MNNQKYMQMAYRLAAKGRGLTSPNPMVGAVIVRQGWVVGMGWHHYCGGPHAEVLALKQAGVAARGGTMYVTLEPCHHYGRTPPCVDAIIKSGIREVVIGMRDPNPLTNGKSIRKLRAHRIKVRCGFMEKELRELNEIFIKYIRRKMPFVTAKIAQTVDGKVATTAGQSKWITSTQARVFARRQRNDFDAILVGINTVLKDDPRLAAGRRNRHLKKIILDSNLRTPLAARVLHENPKDCWIATTAKASAKKITAVRATGAQVILCPQIKAKLNLVWLFRELARREISSLLIEGGATVVGEALKQKLVDKMHIYIAPKIMGDESALSAIKGFRVKKVDECLRLTDLTIKPIGLNLFLEGYVQY